jgi:two-component sensor histidine kinase
MRRWNGLLFYEKLTGGQDVVAIWRFPYRRVEPGFLGSLAFALVFVALAVVARLLLGLIGSTLYFAAFFPAVLVCTLIAGRLAGLLAIPLSIAAVWWAFIPPAYAFGRLSPADIANFTMFALSSLLVVVLAVNHRRNVFALEDREQQRELLVNELEHRSRNMLAVMASLVVQTITDKDEADTLISRMRVSADNQDLLDEHGGATDVRALFTASVQDRYGASRIALTGPDLELSCRQARGLRIVFHEMTTNAVKYGALSDAAGRVEIIWSVDGRTLVIDWRETGGPRVAPPARHNFGSKLIDITLKQMNARLEPTFAETGYCYRIALPLA